MASPNIVLVQGPGQTALAEQRDRAPAGRRRQGHRPSVAGELACGRCREGPQVLARQSGPTVAAHSCNGAKVIDLTRH